MISMVCSTRNTSAPFSSRVCPAAMIKSMMRRRSSSSGKGSLLFIACLGRVAAVNELSRQIAQTGMTLDEAESRLVLARRLPFPKDHVQLLSGLCGAFCFAMMFGGNLRSALAAAGAGLVASWYLLWCGRHEVPGGFQKISTAALITMVCILLCNLLHTSASHAIIGTLMILTPGIAFTMGIRDFVQGDYLSGTIRMIDALLIAASIAIGTGLVLRLYTVFTGVVVV